MALFNKLFFGSNNTNNRGRNNNNNNNGTVHDNNNKAHNNHREKLFAFNKEQVRLVLFRECDFRGRKLLFDSNCVKKVPISTATGCSSSSKSDGSKENEKFVEVSDGFGYAYTRPPGDFSQMAEMVFGSVAMSYRGTYFKIHSLEEPNRIMFTQVFPSPHNRSSSSRKNSHSHHSSPTSMQSLEHSTSGSRLFAAAPDSGVNSASSTKEQLLSSMSSVSTISDLVLVCRKSPESIPPLSASQPSTVSDSGYDPEASFSNGTSTISSTCSMDKGSGTSALSLSSSGLYKRLLRRASTSLENSGILCPHSRGGSTEEYHHLKHPSRSSKLGLSLIVELTQGQEEALSQFFMDHVVLLETIMWRARQVVEMAYLNVQHFVSLMMEVAQLTAQYLVSLLLSDTYISMNLWLLFSATSSTKKFGCDSTFDSISSAFSAALDSDSCLKSDSGRTQTKSSDSVRSNSSLGNFDERRNFSCSARYQGATLGASAFATTGLGGLRQTDSALFSISKLWRLEWDPFHHCHGNSSSVVDQHHQNRMFSAESFVRDFCELLETIDVKDTNFFMSTLITAVLTHHLGWVNTCLPSPSNDNVFLKQTKSPFNPLWDELSDLYGAMGHPTKMAQTIITGVSRKDVISKILVSLTYFIRCCGVDRKIPVRVNVQEENDVVDQLCQQYSCIPKENYKKYEDHLKELQLVNENFLKAATTGQAEKAKYASSSSLPEKRPAINSNATNSLKRASSLAKTQTCMGNLADLVKDPDVTRSTSASKSSNLDSIKENIFFCTDIKSKHFNVYVNSAETVAKKINSLAQISQSTFRPLASFDMKVDLEKQLGEDRSLQENKNNNNNNNSNVVFVLGENEKLVGLKKPVLSQNSLAKRPSFLDLTKTQMSDSDFQDSDFIENKTETSLIKPSTSFTSLNASNLEQEKPGKNKILSRDGRSQSVPPEDRKIQSSETNADTSASKVASKYKYSGVKFNLQQYPQILSNYMKSKNLEMSNLQLGGDKSLKLDDLSSMSDVITSKYPEIQDGFEEGEALQTPSNASEMEFDSDILDPVPPPSSPLSKENKCEDLKEKISNNSSAVINKETERNENVERGDCSNNKTDSRGSVAGDGQERRMKVAHLPMPKSLYTNPMIEPVRYTSSLMRTANDVYMPDMVLQAPTRPKEEWESRLKNDLALASQHSPIDQPIEEAVAVIANTDTWEVQLVSSHTFVLDKSSCGVRVGMSQLVSNMLETLLQMWKLHVPPHYCLMHIEQTLQQLCVRSKALAELLLATEFCTMEHLTNTLRLEVSDVPLLLAVASTHTPEVTQKYGLHVQ